MALHAEAIEILIEKGRFEPEVALGIAEAIEASMMHAQFVTVPILDARLQELKAEIRLSQMSLQASLETKMEGIKAELVRWVFLVMLGNLALTAGATALQEALKHL
jgi:hypothetical protein